jgi:hypothetical protein
MDQIDLTLVLLGSAQCSYPAVLLDEEGKVQVFQFQQIQCRWNSRLHLQFHYIAVGPLHKGIHQGELVPISNCIIRVYHFHKL